MSEQIGFGNTGETITIVQPVTLSGVATFSGTSQVVGGASSTLGFYGVTAVSRQAVTTVTAGGTTTAAKLTIARIWTALEALGLIS